MIVETKGSYFSSERTPKEGEQNLCKKDLITAFFWILGELVSIEQRLYSTEIFNLLKDSLQAQKTELLLLLKVRPQQVRQICFLLKEPDPRVSLDDLTEVLAWSFRASSPIEEQLYSIGIFDYTDGFLVDQAMALLQFLRRPPDEAMRELLPIQKS